MLSSDGAGPFITKPKPPVYYLLGLVDVLKVVDLQVRKLRRSELAESAGPGRQVPYWAIHGELSRYVAAASKPGSPPFDVLEVSDTAWREMAGISTRLAALQALPQHRLVNWGYAACDAALRSYVITAACGRFPYQEGVG